MAAPDVIPIVVPNINLPQFLKLATDATGHCPNRGVDSSPRTFSDYGKFIAILAEFQDRRANQPLTVLRDAGSLLHHLSYSFGVYADTETIFQIKERTDLHIVSTESLDGERIVLVSGTLREWRDATIECCQERQPFNLRLLFDKVVLLFDKFGLGELWDTLRKRPLADHTFLLEDKR
jgi:hypothetical protein